MQSRPLQIYISRPHHGRGASTKKLHLAIDSDAQLTNTEAGRTRAHCAAYPAVLQAASGPRLATDAHDAGGRLPRAQPAILACWLDATPCKSNQQRWPSWASIPRCDVGTLREAEPAGDSSSLHVSTAAGGPLDAGPGPAFNSQRTGRYQRSIESRISLHKARGR